MTWTDDEVFTLVAMRWHGRTNREIGQALGKSPAAVSDRFNRLRREAQQAQSQPRAMKAASVETERDLRVLRQRQMEDCERHAAAVMDQGGFCAFSDSGDKRSPFGIARPLVWPGRRLAA